MNWRFSYVPMRQCSRRRVASPQDAAHTQPLLRPKLLVAALVIGSGCSTQLSPCDRLCKLYEEDRVHPSSSEQAYLLAEKVRREIPEIAEDYGHVANVGIGQRYEFFRMLAREREGKPNWQCQAIRDRYPPTALPSR
jgi:hypothetical protein